MYYCAAGGLKITINNMYFNDMEEGLLTFFHEEINTWKTEILIWLKHKVYTCMKISHSMYNSMIFMY